MMRQIFGILVLGIIFLAGVRGNCAAQFQVPVFTDVTKLAGFSSPWNLLSYSATAGDYNNDGFPDLLISHHGSISLWKNNGDGTFSDVRSIFDQIIAEDTHGVSFIDLNNDGFLDIAVSVGADRGRGKGGNQFYLNREGKSFSFIADASPVVVYDQGRGRSITPADVDHDGKLDLLLFNFPQKQREHRIAIADDIQKNSLFSYHSFEIKGGMELSSAHGCMVVDLIKNKDPLYVLSGLGGDSGKVYLRDGNSFSDVTNDLGIMSDGWCTVVPIDFDNDGDLDLFYGRGAPPPSQLAGVNAKGEINFVVNNRHHLAEFKANIGVGQIGIDIRFENKKDLQQFHLGAHRKELGELPVILDLSSHLLAGDPRVDQKFDKGAYLWVDENNQLIFQFVGDDSLQDTQGYIKPIGFNFAEFSTNILPSQTKRINSLYRNDEGHFVDVAKQAGVEGTGGVFSALAADFNNDGFMDLYTVNIGQTVGELNESNALFINNGDGSFVETAAKSGASGPATGIGNGAIPFDYDGDGDLDLFLYNGRVAFPIEPGPFTLLRNDSTNINKAIQIEVRGSKYNNRGIGAKLLVRNEKYKLMLLKHGLDGFLSTSDLPFHVGVGDREYLDEITLIGSSVKTEIRKLIPAGSKLTIHQRQ